VVFDQSGRAVEHLHALYRPDRYAFEMDLVRSGTADTKAWSPVMSKYGARTGVPPPNPRT
jgi:GntR family transcriptional regulator